MVIKMKTINLVLILATVFVIGALAGKLTGMAITAPAVDLSANTLTATNINSATGIINVASNIRATKTIMGVASERDIGVSGSSPGGRGLFGRSETGYGIEGYANTASGYSGYFHGGKGLYTDNIIFGTTAFQGAKGQLVLFAGSRTACTGVCNSHGLACSATYAIESGILRDVGGCLYSTGAKFCFCG